jgi:glycosyltransferase involved in cell wall biosynthesis
VVLAVHFRISQSDEWADKGYIGRTGRTYRSIRELERRTVPAVDGLVFVSAWGRAALHEWMPEAFGVPGVVIPNFVRAPSRSLDETVAPQGDLVTVGNLEAIKNHRYLLQVLALARARGFRYTLDVFGEGVERNALAALATELGIQTQVRLLGFRRDAQQELPRYRVLVHASYSDSLPLAIVEAMGAGLPVVSSDTGGIPELFRDPEHGRFWPLDDPERGAQILIDLLESDQELERAGTAAREKFRAEYDADVVAPRLVSFLRSGPCRPVSSAPAMAGGDHGRE